MLNYAGRPSLYLGFFTTAWGLVSLLTSQVNSYGSIVACRFILGLVEAPFVSPPTPFSSMSLVANQK